MQCAITCYSLGVCLGGDATCQLAVRYNKIYNNGSDYLLQFQKKALSLLPDICNNWNMAREDIASKWLKIASTRCCKDAKQGCLPLYS